MLRFPMRLLTLSAGIAAMFGSLSAKEHTLDDLSWLEGYWIDTRNPEKQIEVRWNARHGDAMVGTWRRNNGANLAYYEVLTMRETDGVVYYRFDFYAKDEESGLFEQTSSTRLKLIEAQPARARFEVVGEENWILTMKVENDVLQGWMQDTDKPESARNYSYVANKQ